MVPYYKRFGAGYKFADFSEFALLEMYRHETYGEPLSNPMNGYALGKKWMDVTVAMWKEDLLTGILIYQELLNDHYETWFLDKLGVYKAGIKP